MKKIFAFFLIILFSNLLKAAELKKFIIEINGESTYEINGTVYYSIAALEQSF